MSRGWHTSRALAPCKNRSRPGVRGCVCYAECSYAERDTLASVIWPRIGSLRARERACRAHLSLARETLGARTGASCVSRASAHAHRFVRILYMMRYPQNRHRTGSRALISLTAPQSGGGDGALDVRNEHNQRDEAELAHAPPQMYFTPGFCSGCCGAAAAATPPAMALIVTQARGGRARGCLAERRRTSGRRSSRWACAPCGCRPQETCSNDDDREGHPLRSPRRAGHRARGPRRDPPGRVHVRQSRRLPRRLPQVRQVHPVRPEGGRVSRAREAGRRALDRSADRLDRRAGLRRVRAPSRAACFG